MTDGLIYPGVHAKVKSWVSKTVEDPSGKGGFVSGIFSRLPCSYVSVESCKSLVAFIEHFVSLVRTSCFTAFFVPGLSFVQFCCAVIGPFSWSLVPECGPQTAKQVQFIREETGLR